MSHAEVRLRVAYGLTSTGRTLIVPAVSLAQWVVEHNRGIECSQQTYDADPG